MCTFRIRPKIRVKPLATGEIKPTQRDAVQQGIEECLLLAHHVRETVRPYTEDKP